MGAEDFSLFGEGNVPICMFWVGTIDSDRLEAARSKHEDLPALHSSKYYPDPAPSIATGIRAMTAAVVKLLPANVPSGRRCESMVPAGIHSLAPRGRMGLSGSPG